ncbi:cupin domain-containing protein [Actinomadura opuntiae]|uniref:cupin domain-containing protein n=1 Tax=Actinomadura sp. OS1-43 TaxID=604315 RepID=UPI00255ABB2B|nr:cupin domain-containing protein [Actinomadura sp. OS1-43]MDL4821796.1 cupin domain-containing protein [Actinomadura sp. OS1-43]
MNPAAPPAAVDDLYRDVSAADLQPLWRLQGLLTEQPTTRAFPHRWPGTTLRSLAGRARDLVPIGGGGDRRVLACANPGLGGAPYATPTLWAAVQALAAGERAPAHRHTPAALRFVLDGAGVWTAVDGDALHMSRGDLVLTPSWTFHEHYNPGERPMTWLDVLDLPIVQFLGAVFYQPGEAAVVDARPARSASEHRFGGGPGLLPQPLDGPVPPAHSPLLAYRWPDTDRALALLLADGADHARVRFTDPTTGRDAMPTLRCEMIRVAAASVTGGSRQTGSQVLTVFSGEGRAVVGGVEFPLEQGDVVAVPSWATLSLSTGPGLDLFCVSDAPVLEGLGLYRRIETDD